MSGFIQSLKKRLIAVGVILAVLAAAGGWWYMNIYTKTPEYALKMVQEAVVSHDKERFYQYVDIDHLLDSASNDMMDGLIQMMVPVTGDTREAVSGLTKMFKEPVVMSLKSALDNYVLYGTWDSSRESKESISSIVDADMIVHRIGLPSIQFQKLTSIAVDADKGTAIAKIEVLQEEANEEFVLDVELIERENGSWQIYEITNFKAFIEKLHNLRQGQIKRYLDESADLMQRHDEVIAQADKEISDILTKGSLGSNASRGEVKAVLEAKIIPDWQARKAELEAMQVPESAGSLHRLHLKICEARIEAAADYARWMDDKKAATIRSADNSLKMAKTLEKEAEFLTKQVNAHVK